MVVCSVCHQNTRWVTYCPSHYEHEALCTGARAIWRKEELKKETKKMNPPGPPDTDKNREKISRLSLMPTFSYPMTPKLQEILSTVYSFPVGHIKSDLQVNRILENIQVYLEVSQINQQSVEFKYLLLFYQDLAKVLIMRTEPESTKQNLFGFILQLQEQ